MNHLTHFRKITILRFVLAGLVLLFSVPALFADGIASRYPNDVGIENDPAVLLFEGFERYQTPSQMIRKNGGQWDGNGGNIGWTIDTSVKFSGTRSAQVQFPIVSSE
jgi:hypothetical protein